jgi:hypothetical protein
MRGRKAVPSHMDLPEPVPNVLGPESAGMDSAARGDQQQLTAGSCARPAIGEEEGAGPGRVWAQPSGPPGGAERQILPGPPATAPGICGFRTTGVVLAPDAVPAVRAVPQDIAST